MKIFVENELGKYIIQESRENRKLYPNVVGKEQFEYSPRVITIIIDNSSEDNYEQIIEEAENIYKEIISKTRYKNLPFTISYKIDDLLEYTF